MKKTDNFGGSYLIYIFFLLTPLRIFVPRLEIIIFINHYFLVCIFKYRRSPRVYSLTFLFLFWVRYLAVLFIFKKISIVAATAAKPEQQQQQQQRVGVFDPPIEYLQ